MLAMTAEGVCGGQRSLRRTNARRGMIDSTRHSVRCAQKNGRHSPRVWFGTLKPPSATVSLPTTPAAAPEPYPKVHLSPVDVKVVEFDELKAVRPEHFRGSHSFPINQLGKTSGYDTMEEGIELTSWKSQCRGLR